jgi:hypothetical protein
VNQDIEILINYLNHLGEAVVTTWIGPFIELRLEPTWTQIRLSRVKTSSIVRNAFLDLDKQIKGSLNRQTNSFRYVSLIDILDKRQFEFKVDSCILFRDVDHWSTCAEKMFSMSLERGLQK